MQSLLDFLAKYYHWLLFLVLEGISFVLLFQFNHYHNSVWLTTANTVVGQVSAWEQEAIRFVHLGEVNAALTERNLQLEQQNAMMQEQLLELTHDSTFTEQYLADVLTDVHMIRGKVVTNSITHRDNYITIDLGEADGVKPEMGVVSGTGIVGIVYMTSAHYSIVMPLLNSKSRISCRLHGTRYFGYLKWDGTDPLYATLDDIPRHARFNVGDVVETSGFSAVFPAGLFVGKVAAIENSDDGLSYQLRIHLGTDIARLQDISILTESFYEEQHQLEQKADSLQQ
mgnify:CR=1 FL=1